MPAKTAEEKQIERQWMILHELDRQSRATKGVTKQELADLCGVSKRTIDRDMIDLSLSASRSGVSRRDGSKPGVCKRVINSSFPRWS